MAESSTKVSSSSSSLGEGKAILQAVGMFSALVLGVQCVSLVTSGLWSFSAVVGLFPGSNLIFILIAAMVAILFLVYVYAFIGAVAQRSGADYIFASRTLNAPLAFAASWTLVFFTSIILGSLLVSIPQALLPVFLRILATSLRSSALMEFSLQAAQPGSMILTGVFLILIAFLLSIGSLRLFWRSIQIGFFLVLVSWGGLFYQLATAPLGSFPTAWNQWVGGMADFQQRVELARSAGMVVNPVPGLAILAGLALSFSMFLGFFAPALMAGEVKQPEKTLLLSQFFTVFIVGLILIIAALLLQRLVPGEWLSAESYLYRTQPNKLSLPWIYFYAAILRPNLILVSFIFMSWIYGLINLVQVYFIVLSRIVLAWVDDRIAPSWLGYLHPSSKSPIIIILILAILAQLSMAEAAVGHLTSIQYTFALLAAVTGFIPVLAATIFPFRRKAWFEGAGRFVRLKIGPVPVISLVGSLSLIYLVWLAIQAVVIIQAFAPQRLYMALVLGLLFISGLIWYFARVSNLRRRGIDIQQYFKKPLGATVSPNSEE